MKLIRFTIQVGMPLDWTIYLVDPAAAKALLLKTRMHIPVFIMRHNGEKGIKDVIGLILVSTHREIS